MSERAFTVAVELLTILRRLKQKLHDQSERSELTPSQMSVLVRLEKGGPAPVSTLARAEGMRPQSMSAIITSLLEAGMVSGSPDPNDGRQTLMSLSRKSQKLFKEGRAARQNWLVMKVQSKLSTREVETLAAAVDVLSRLVED